MNHSQGTVGTGILNYQPATTCRQADAPARTCTQDWLIIPNESPLSPLAELRARLTCTFTQGLSSRDRRGHSH